MKEVILKQDLVYYLQKEILRVKNTSPKVLSDIKDDSFIEGYREGQIMALNHVLKDLWLRQIVKY